LVWVNKSRAELKTRGMKAKLVTRKLDCSRQTKVFGKQRGERRSLVGEALSRSWWMKTAAFLDRQYLEA
jgi:hypothetical protein